MELEIIKVESNTSKITITPKRITLKVSTNLNHFTLDELQELVIALSTNIVVEESFRGIIKVIQERNKIKTYMKNGNGKKILKWKYTFDDKKLIVHEIKEKNLISIESTEQ